MRKIFIPLTVILSVAVVLSSVLFAACSKQSEYPIWDISADGGKITASFSDNGRYGFILTIEGSGAMPDYASKKDAPWYGKSGRITDIVISEGITSVGTNAFSDCAAKTVVLPESVTAIGENSFSATALICAYSQVSAPDGVKVYIYSAEKPAAEGNYWRYIGETPTAWEPIKILFIGNSFTYYNELPSLFAKIATGAGEFVEVDSVTCGAWTLEKFADPDDEYGKIVDEKLSSADDYDVVVLQEQSTRPLNNYNRFLEAARSLQTRINQTQKECRIYLYSTWGYPKEAESRNISVPEMEAGLRTAYENVARELGVEVSYVGAAFTTVYNDYPQINLYFSDDTHPSYAGSYLSACVHVATILNCDPRTTSYTESLDGETASILQNVAYTTVFG